MKKKPFLVAFLIVLSVFCLGSSLSELFAQDYCDTEGKPISLTLEYTGGGCTATNHVQDSDKVECSGSINPSLAITVTTSTSDYILTPSTVNPNQTFTVTKSGGTRLNSEVDLALTNAGGTEDISFHTSCSQPLRSGDVFGSLTLVDYIGEGCTSDAWCDDGLWCNGEETCDLGSGNCLAGTPPDCDDGVDCTTDICDEDVDACMNNPNDAICGNADVCDGIEICDPINGCQAGTPPDCDDGLWCNGEETCDPINGCQAGTPPDCDDGVDCTTDICDEDIDACMNNPNDGDCDDGLYCNGMEFCDPVNDCQPGVLPCTENEVCDENNDMCISEKIVSVDIKPGSCPNPMRLKCSGVLPAAILGTDDLDVSTIDPTTIMITREGIIGGVPLIRHSYEDVGTPFEGELCDCHTLTKDGYIDLTLKFMVGDVVEELMLDEFEDRETIPLTIVGETYDGTPIKGEDCIWIIGDLKQECNADLDCDADVDGSDAAMFKEEFGRRNCFRNNPCIADFQVDGDVDGSDALTFKSEFGTILLW